MAIQSAGHLLEATRADACMRNLEQAIGRVTSKSRVCVSFF
jgi:hypothetical protein